MPEARLRVQIDDLQHEVRNAMLGLARERNLRAKLLSELFESYRRERDHLERQQAALGALARVDERGEWQEERPGRALHTHDRT